MQYYFIEKAVRMQLNKNKAIRDMNPHSAILPLVYGIGRMR